MAEPELKPGRPGAIDTLEQAFSLLKKLPPDIKLAYYTGTIPFVAGGLYFFYYMSKNAFAAQYCLASSLGLAVLYVWMRAWQSIACTRAFRFVGQYTATRLSAGSILKMAIVQTIFHTFSIFVLFVAAIATIPFAWIFSMYQMSFVHLEPEKIQMFKRLKTDFKAATQNTMTNHLVISMISFFSLFVFANTAMAIYLIPILLKAFFGIESGVTLGGFSLMNTTFLFSAAAVTYLVVDPLFKAIYVVLKYNAQSGKTGDDLISAFKRASSVSGKVLPMIAGLVIVGFLLAGPHPCAASELSMQSAKNPAVDQIEPENLEGAIQTVLEQPAYAWKLHRKTTEVKKDGFLHSAAQWLASWVKKGYDWIADKVSRFVKWLWNLSKRDQPDKPKEFSSKSILKPSHLVIGLILLMAILLAVVIYHFRQLKKQDRSQKEKSPELEIDIHDETLTADQLPGDQWLKMAREFLEQGQIRLAVRAIYLCTLARLADQGFLKIAMHKSNQDYQNELLRKSMDIEPVATDFSSLVKVVEQVWYGMYPADQGLYDEFFDVHERVVGHEAG